ncbi:MAG: acetyl-CoA decarbonylase/synthase complex subunit delta [Deltaproteobacteria bacterium]|nr:acetyl-CoA decarbonylase/synthase complex subunit delta [Deltaproteobacteria bacterium]MBW2120407.1 acetyl-CoA decarbonylase/synthase complex subunit delta [Deltaproteobacteria bacterium]
MAFEIPKINYTGKIKSIKVGRPDRAVEVGDETSYPFHLFEGEMPNPPRIAMEVYDAPPEEWAEEALKPFEGVTDDPVAWAKRNVEQYKADLVYLELISTDPNGLNRSSDEAAETARRVADAIDVPLIVWGVDNDEKDAEVLRRVAEVCEGRNVIIGPVVEGNYKQIGAGAIAYKHTVVASTPIDINLAKQLNILLGNLGVPDEQILVDPTTGGLGYGIEYTYSVMERMRMAALTQQDERLQFPMICNMAREVWKTKEAKLSEQEAPAMGDPGKRGILMEAVTAVILLLAGADILVMRHPDAVRLTREMVNDLMAAG